MTGTQIVQMIASRAGKGSNITIITGATAGRLHDLRSADVYCNTWIDGVVHTKQIRIKIGSVIGPVEKFNNVCCKRVYQILTSTPRCFRPSRPCFQAH